MMYLSLVLAQFFACPDRDHLRNICKISISKLRFVLPDLFNGIPGPVHLESKMSGASVKHKESATSNYRRQLVGELIDVLEELLRNPAYKHFRGRGQCSYCENIFIAIYKLYSEKMDIEPEEQKMIANLIVSVFPHLANGVKEFRGLPKELGGYILKVRSGVQFFVDKFKDFYYEDGKTLEELLKGLQRYLDGWNGDLLFWKADNFYMFYAFPKPDEFKRPFGVPETHLWWED